MQRRQKSVVEEKAPQPHAPVNSPPTSQSGYDEGTTLRIDQLHAKPTTPRFVYILTTFSAIGGFLFGYDTGVIAGAMILLRDTFLLSYVWQELVVSVTIAAAAIFALVGGSLNDSVGRKPVILVASLIFTVGALCLACATDRFMLLFGRFLVGVGIGKSTLCSTLPILSLSVVDRHDWISLGFSFLGELWIALVFYHIASYSVHPPPQYGPSSMSLPSSFIVVT